MLSALVKYDVVGKGNTSLYALAKLLNHGTDEQRRKNADSKDPVAARVAKTLLENHAKYCLSRPKALAPPP